MVFLFDNRVGICKIVNITLSLFPTSISSSLPVTCLVFLAITYGLSLTIYMPFLSLRQFHIHFLILSDLLTISTCLPIFFLFIALSNRVLLFNLRFSVLKSFFFFFFEICSFHFNQSS